MRMRLRECSSALQHPHSSLQVPATQAAAEQAIISFRNSSNPLPACLYILQQSTSYDAQFYAALTLRQYTMTSWPLMSSEQRSHLQAWIREHALHLGSNGVSVGAQGALLKAVIALHALLLKRQWVMWTDEGQRSSITVRAQPFRNASTPHGVRLYCPLP
jgi:hypothetical protein